MKRVVLITLLFVNLSEIKNPLCVAEILYAKIYRKRLIIPVSPKLSNTHVFSLYLFLLCEKHEHIAGKHKCFTK